LLRNVWVDDRTGPRIGMPLPVALFGCGPATLHPPTAIDDCSGTPTVTGNPPAFFEAGGTIVTWTARDASGNTASVNQLVSVLDGAPPSLSCPLETPNVDNDRYVVAASDAPCTVAPIIRFGGYTLLNGDHIRLIRWIFPGIHLISDTNGLKTFRVGFGDDTIQATDTAGNVSFAECRPSNSFTF
jgi:hypothetical protein